MPLTESAKKQRFGNTEPTYLQDFDANGNLIFEGYSAPGTPQSKPGFTIVSHVYQSVTINGATIWQDIKSSILDGVIWTARAHLVDALGQVGI